MLLLCRRRWRRLGDKKRINSARLIVRRIIICRRLPPTPPALIGNDAPGVWCGRDEMRSQAPLYNSAPATPVDVGLCAAKYIRMDCCRSIYQ